MDARLHIDSVSDSKLLAAVSLLRRTGAQSFRVGYSDPEDGLPTVWYACATYSGDKAEAAAALDPTNATLRLAEKVIDGGICNHCGRMSSFVPDTDTEVLDQFTCVYAWDPELKTFRRNCEGDTRGRIGGMG